ncbi:MAG: peptide deformylase [Nitrospirae bacterium]|nr:peptide deformylase [Nitrospirota bacterium]
MSVRGIREYPDPILRQMSRRVEKWDDNLRRLIQDMKDTLDAIPGLGLAAVQVGEPVRLFIYDPGLSSEGPLINYSVFINPVITFKEGEVKGEEGCLSVPDFRESVVRSEIVTVKGNDMDGNSMEITAEGLLARVFQHEIDHINGVLFIDHLSSLKRGLFLRRMKKRERQQRAEMSGRL